MSNNISGPSYRNPGQGGQYYSDNRRGNGGNGGGGGGYGQGRARHGNHGYGRKDWRRVIHQGDTAAEGARPLRVDLDGDVMMGDDNDGGSRRYNPYNPKRRHNRGKQQRGGGSPSSYGGRGGRDNFANRPDSWGKVVIPYGKKLNKEVLMKLLAAGCSLPFVPYNFHYEGNSAIFYLKDISVAIEIKKMNGKKITDTFTLRTTMRFTNRLQIVTSEDILKLLKACIMKRYIPNNCALDLSNFHQDPGLISEGLVLYFTMNNILMEVVKIINEIIPEIKCLDLSGNELQSLELITKTREKMFNLQVLLLNKNKFVKLSDLNALNGYPLEELNLTDNPVLRSNSKDHPQYVETLRKRFPNLQKLDGIVLPPQIGFDVEKPVNLPPFKDSYFANEQGKEIAIKFFEQYLTLYDSTREGVIDAYHDNAVFSLIMLRNEHRSGPGSVYFHSSRNLLRMTDSEKRNKQLYRGKYEIMRCLTSLPKSQHDTTSICLDVISSNERFTSVFLSGVFKDFENPKSEVLRAFSRSFILVPFGPGGFKIVNDMLSITHPSNEQRSQAFKIAVPTPTSGPVPSTSAPIDDLLIKQQMVESFSKQSGMITDWSVRCLEEWHWDFNKAAQAFTELNANGAIPREAFALVNDAKL